MSDGRPTPLGLKTTRAENPFDELDIDPHSGPGGITERMRELIEEATDEAERTRLRALWQELTMHPGRRVRLALLAHPESRAPLGAPPSRAFTTLTTVITAETVTLGDLALLPAVAAALGAHTTPDEDDYEETEDPVLTLE
jgi:hypothetical protein